MNHHPPSYRAELALACALARRGGAQAVDFFRSRSFSVNEKAGDQGPVTDADQAVNALILQGILDAFPEDCVAAEESDLIEHGERTWFVDPIDGTTSFVAGEPEFAVMIGFAVAGEPVLGVVYQPLRDELYAAVRGHGAHCHSRQGVAALAVSTRERAEEACAMRSRAHPCARTDALFAAIGVTHHREMGSMGLKIVEIAAGRAELYANLSGKPAQWDAAAPLVILHEAGGRVSNAWGEPLRFDADSLYLREGLLASNQALHERLVAACHERMA